MSSQIKIAIAVVLLVATGILASPLFKTADEPVIDSGFPETSGTGSMDENQRPVVLPVPKDIKAEETGAILVSTGSIALRQVTIRMREGVDVIATLTSDGALPLTGLELNSDMLELSAPGHVTVHVPRARLLERRALHLPEAIAFAGEVRDAVTRKPIERFRVSIEPSDDEPSEVEVPIWPSPGREFVHEGGEFSADDFMLAVGMSYRLRVTADGYAENEIATWRPRVREESLRINMIPAGSFVGTVQWREDNEPVAGAKIELEIDGRAFTTTSDRDGEFELKGLPYGHATGTISHRQGLTEPLEFAFRTTAVSDYTGMLFRVGTVTCRPDNDFPQFGRGVSVTLTIEDPPQGFPERMHSQHLVAADRRAVMFEGVPPGSRLSVRVNDATRPEWTFKSVVQPASASSPDRDVLVPAQYASGTLKVAIIRQGAVSNAVTVTLKKEDFESREIVVGAEDESCRFGPLEPGDYTVVVSGVTEPDQISKPTSRRVMIAVAKTTTLTVTVR